MRRFFTWMTTPKKPLWLYTVFLLVFVVTGLMATEQFWQGNTLMAVIAAIVVGFVANILAGYLVERLVR